MWYYPASHSVTILHDGSYSRFAAVTSCKVIKELLKDFFSVDQDYIDNAVIGRPLKLL